MSFWGLVGTVLAAGALVALAWSSVQSLLQARLLGRCRNASLAGLHGCAAAIRGPVRVRQVLRIAHIGDVLWHREIVKARRGQAVMIDSDIADKADFSILVGGEEVRVAEIPTEVQGPASMTSRDGFGKFSLSRQDVIEEWLPVLDELTAVGRLRHGDAGWEIAADPKAGLFLSVRDPKAAAWRESLKGWLGLAGSAAGFAALIVLHFRLY